MTELGKKEQELFKILRSLPPVKVVDNKVLTSHTPCAACGANTYLGDFAIYDSQVIPSVVSPVCRDCNKELEDKAKLVCCACRTIIGWIDPHKDKDGFIFGKGSFYHIQACPCCTPGLDKSDIIEKVLYLNRVKNKIL